MAKSKKSASRLTPQGWHKSPIAGRVHYQSTYEHKFMIYLDEKKFNWSRCKERFPYTGVDGKVHHYNPDFYLPDYNLYVEVKGMIRVNDPLKFEAFPKDKRLVLIDADKLISLGIDCFVPDLTKVDKTKWPYTMLSKIPDYAAPGQLSEVMRRRLSEHLDVFKK